jgi:hypothetical protein
VTLLAAQAAADPVVSWALRVFLAAVFARALYGKLRAPGEFARAIRGYEILPERHGLALASAGALLALEGALVAGLLLPGAASIAAAGAAGLLALYSAAIALNLARGRRDIDCGCAGPGRSAALHEWLLARNGLYIAMALCAGLPQAARELVWLDAATLGLAVVSLSILALAFEALVAQAPRVRRNEVPR